MTTKPFSDDYADRADALPTRQQMRRAKRQAAGLRHAQIFHTFSFLFVLFLFGILSLVLPKPTVSEVEKRELAEMPEFSTDALIEGSYVRGVELHYADTFPFREQFILLRAWINDLRGLRLDGIRLYSQTPANPTPVDPVAPDLPSETQPSGDSSGSAVPPEAPDEEEPYTPHVVADDGDNGEWSGNIFVYKGKAMSVFGAGGTEMADWYASILNRYKEAWGEDVNVYSLVIPTSIEFALPERLQSLTASQKDNIDYIYSQLEGIAGVDAYRQLEMHADEYLYFNSDHHWTGRGAYYAYVAFCESAGLTPLPLDAYERHVIENFRGTMYAYTTDVTLEEDYVEYFISPTPESAVRYDRGDPYTARSTQVWVESASGGNAYSVFLGGDYPLIKITTEAGTGRKVLMTKESFGNAFAPFLIDHYDEVYVVDQRYFQLPLVDFVRENGIDDVIFVNNSFAANTAVRIRELEGIMYQRYTPTPVQQDEPEPEPATPARPEAEDSWNW